MQETDHGDVSTSAAGKELEISSSVLRHDDKLEDKRRKRMDEKSRSVEAGAETEIEQVRSNWSGTGNSWPSFHIYPPKSGKLTASCYDVEIHRIE